MGMKRIARASIAGLLLATVLLAITGALYEMIGRWRDARRFPQRGHLVQAGSIRWMQIAGLCLMSAGFVLWTIARFQLGASFAVKAEARQLVTHGLYSKIRNPIYVFGSWVFAGAILVFGKPLWLLIFVGLIPTQIWRAKKESAVLEAAFGESTGNIGRGLGFEARLHEQNAASESSGVPSGTRHASVSLIRQ
jgi:protein-S-isoprenylcysteine O-methyltransferase Ste14